MLAGGFGYDDDLKWPSQLIKYKCKWARTTDPGTFINNAKVLLMSGVIYLGQCLNKNIYKFSANRCVKHFNWQCNMLFANFKYAN